MSSLLMSTLGYENKKNFWELQTEKGKIHKILWAFN